MGLFWKILKKFIKFVLLFALSSVIAFFSSRIPIKGIEIISVSGPDCGDVLLGLPFAWKAKFSVEPNFGVATCAEPGDMQDRLIMLSSDIIFWISFLYAAVYFFKKLIKHKKSGCVK